MSKRETRKRRRRARRWGMTMYVACCMNRPVHEPSIDNGVFQGVAPSLPSRLWSLVVRRTIAGRPSATARLSTKWATCASAGQDSRDESMRNQGAQRTKAVPTIHAFRLFVKAGQPLSSHRSASAASSRNYMFGIARTKHVRRMIVVHCLIDPLAPKG